MKKKHQASKKILSLFSVMLLAGCSTIPQDSYFNRAAPEELLDISSETISVPLDSERSIDELIDWIDSDQPTRAQLYCFEEDLLCVAAEEVLSLYGVEYEILPSDGNMVNFEYERMLAHDCENSYIDNSVNPYNLNHPTFGCSIASNMLQMVTDRSQFVAPELLGYADAEKALTHYGKYLDEEPEKADENKYTIQKLETSE